MTGSVLHEVVLPRLGQVKKTGASYSARCPAHDDNNPSLSVAPGHDQPVLLKCHAGCSQEAILEALGLTWADISAPREERPGDPQWTPAGPASHVYDYRDHNGELLFQVLRVPQPGGGKTFRQRVPDVTTKSGWRWALGDVQRTLYRLPEVLTAVAEGREVYIAEGEKDVDALRRSGAVATCNSGGAGKWRPEYSQDLAEAHVKIVADTDRPGQAHARDVAERLTGIAASVTILEPAVGKDASDHLAAGRGLDDFQVTWASDVVAHDGLEPDLYEFLSVEDPPEIWVIPRLLQRADRLIWTGFEGLGKSLVLRQVAIGAAAGLHPFEENLRFSPQKVLYIDCENSERQGRDNFRLLERVAREKNCPVPADNFYPIHRPAGIDLSRAEDAAWLLERVTRHKPDLLVCGPFYRLHGGASEEETASRKVVAALDAARVQADCAVLVEHHTPHGPGGERQLRPFGSSLLMRWPEMGMGIAPAEGSGDPCQQVVVKRWRGNRGVRHWPQRLHWAIRDDEWPWVAEYDRG